MQRMLVVLLLGTLAGGCASYYEVTDPSTGRAYYTDRVRKERGGAVQLIDARTGNEVTIQNSEVKKITKQEYESNRLQSGR